jgi:ABC-2 type transport system ATP-binding protein
MIKVENLVKTFGRKRAVDDVSFTVKKGEILGFLGPNGAGKSTTMRMVTGFIPPTAGRISVGDFDMLDQPVEAKRLLGYLPESAPCYPDMTVLGFLKFSAEIRGLSGSERNSAIDKAIELCFLQSVKHQSVDTLSKGFRHRTCFAQSIIHDPEILIMDEPTDGLDPNQKREIRQLIRRMGEKKAIIFSTHILEEVEAVCDRAMIIDHGKIVADGTPADLKARSELAGSVSLKVKGTAASAIRGKIDAIDLVAKTTTVEEQDGLAWVRAFPKDAPKNGEVSAAVAAAASKEGWNVVEVYTEKGRLDEVFWNITETDSKA